MKAGLEASNWVLSVRGQGVESWRWWDSLRGGHGVVSYSQSAEVRSDRQQKKCI